MILVFLTCFSDLGKPKNAKKNWSKFIVKHNDFGVSSTLGDGVGTQRLGRKNTKIIIFDNEFASFSFWGGFWVPKSYGWGEVSKLRGRQPTSQHTSQPDTYSARQLASQIAIQGASQPASTVTKKKLYMHHCNIQSRITTQPSPMRFTI